MIITKISPQTKDPLRENIYLDGKFGFGIQAEARFENKLKVGQDLSEDRVAELVLADQVSKLFFSAQRFLSFRPRSIKELKDNLKRKLDKGDYTNVEKILDQVIQNLVKIDLVGDEEFAKWWVDQRQKFRPKGERVLRSELHAKGIDREIIDQIFQAYETPCGEIERIATKKAASLSKLSPLEFKTKLTNFLARRGYDWDEIGPVVDRLSRRA